jgi:hypothetical protein
MKKSALGALAIFALVVPSVFAAPPTIAQMVMQRVDHLTLLLSLSPMQQTQATGFFTTELTANQPLEAKLRTDRQALEADVKANAPQSKLASDADAVGSDEGSILGNSSFAEAQFLSILSPTDQMKYEKLGRRGFGGGFGGPGPGGFGERGH